MTEVWVLYMTSTLVITKISAEILFCKAETWYYHIYTLLYTLVMQNIVSNKEKQKLSQILSFKKLMKGLSLVHFWRLLMMKEQFTYS